MKSYQKEADRYFATHHNRYLAHADSITLTQCYNFLRCKKVYEAMLFKTSAKTTSWHKQAEVFYHPDSAVKSKGLMEFAYVTFGFTIGEHDDRIWTKGPESHQWFFMVDIDSSGKVFLGRTIKPGMYFYPKQAYKQRKTCLKPQFQHR